MDGEQLKTAVQDLVQRIYDKNGEVTPSELVEAAKSKDEPAHAAFEWNDKKAGREFRLIQARKWLRVVVIRSEAQEDGERLVHVPIAESDVREDGPKEGSYKPASVLVHSVDEFERALDEAMQRLHSARRAVEDLRSVAEKSDKPERAAMVAQVSRALDIMQQAIQSVH